jgi:hypothetical protein
MRSIATAAAVIAAASLALVACGDSQPSASTVAATVNGTAISMQSYKDAVQALRGRVEQRTGHVLNPNTPGDAQRLAQVESTGIRGLVAAAVIEQLAATRHISVTSADVDTALRTVSSGDGNADQLVADLGAAGLTDSSTHAAIRILLLQQRLRATDPAGYDTTFANALRDASVVVYAAPCDTDHTYPACLQAN